MSGKTKNRNLFPGLGEPKTPVPEMSISEAYFFAAEAGLKNARLMAAGSIMAAYIAAGCMDDDECLDSAIRATAELEAELEAPKGGAA